MFKNLFVHQNKYIQKKQRVGRNIYDEEYSVTGWTLDSKTIFFFFPLIFATEQRSRCYRFF